MKGNFLASLNHEIRTPLSGFLGMTDLLLETELTEEQREYAATSRECAIQLLDTLNSVLEYSSVSAGVAEPTLEEFPVRQLMESIEREMAGRVEVKGIHLSCTVDSNVPETLVGDPHAIRQILNQLVRNGVKFTNRGHVKASIGCENGEDGSKWLWIDVADTGIGIAQEQLNGIFDSFHQAEAGLARRYAGLGLGLAITERLVNRLGGVIEVTSRMGYGSCFRVKMPIRVTGNPSGQDSSAAGGNRLLLVEDDPVAQRVLLHYLENSGYLVDMANDGEQGIAAAEAHTYDLILMDMQMPRTDGLEAARRIRQISQCAGLPILMLTANTSKEHRNACVEVGAQGFLSKPIQKDDLLEAIQHHISRNQRVPAR
jgi:CheY-like chemotaxis protein